MIYSFSDEPKQWNNKCPECDSVIKWNHVSSKSGTKSIVHCSNNLIASRIHIKSLRDIKSCFWKGYVVRQKDGGIRFSNKNGEWIKQPVL